MITLFTQVEHTTRIFVAMMLDSSVLPIATHHKQRKKKKQYSIPNASKKEELLRRKKLGSVGGQR